MRVLKSIAATNRLPQAANFLINDGSMKANFIPVKRKNQFTAVVDLDCINTVEIKGNAFSAGVWRDYKIVFKLMLVAVINEINARGYIIDLNLGKNRKIRAPR